MGGCVSFLYRYNFFCSSSLYFIYAVIINLWWSKQKKEKFKSPSRAENHECLRKFSIADIACTPERENWTLGFWFVVKATHRHDTRVRFSEMHCKIAGFRSTSRLTFTAINENAQHSWSTSRLVTLWLGRLLTFKSLHEQYRSSNLTANPE